MNNFNYEFNDAYTFVEVISGENIYNVQFFYYYNLIYQATLVKNTWAKTSDRSNHIKIFDENENLIFEKKSENNLLTIWSHKSDDNFIQTIQNFDWSTVHSRVLTHEGTIVDVGCLFWDWSSYFIGKKRVIGVDPFEVEIEGAEIFNGLIGSFDGKTLISDEGAGSSVFSNNKENLIEYPVLSWKTFCKSYNIDNISILKLNIEGGEYSLLNSLDIEDYKKIDQIVISFHDWYHPNWVELTNSALQLLQNNKFEIVKINRDFNWYLALNTINDW
jgi:hypothetical protein